MKILRPTKIEGHLEYRCPNCSLEHWLTLRETQTKGFKVVCTCDTVFGVKTVDKLKIKYKNKPNPIDSTTQKVPDIELVNKCMAALGSYGFEKSEIEPIVIDAIRNVKSQNILDIVKACIINFGVKHEQYD